MIIDLTHVLDETTPVYPGDPPFKAETSARFADAGYEGHQLTMGTHAGTHIDAPAHMIKSGKSINEYQISSFVGRGVYIDLSVELDIDALKGADIQPHDIVLINTGWHQKFYEPSYFKDFPILSAEAVEYLIDKRVRMVGLDTCSADNSPEFRVHKALLGADILIIENLANLDVLAEVQEFVVHALPLRLGLDGSPARVIASAVY